MWPVRIDPHERVRSDELKAVFVNVSVCQATAASCTGNITTSYSRVKIVLLTPGLD